MELSFRTTSDTETIVQLIAKSKRNKFLDKLIEALFQIKGGICSNFWQQIKN